MTVRAPLLAVLLGALAPAAAHAAAPAVVVDGPAMGVTGRPVAFDGSRTTDPDGDELRYAWAIDGEDVAVTDPWLGVAFAHPGRHVVALTVIDATGAAAGARRTIDVRGADRRISTLSPIGPALGSGTAAVPELVLRPPVARVVHRTLRLQVRCRGAARCAGTLRAVALVGRRGRPALLAARRFSIRRGGPRVVRLRLGPKARRRLARHARVRVTAYRGVVRVASIWATTAYRVPAAQRRR